jgi:hypothetical protein
LLWTFFLTETKHGRIRRVRSRVTRCVFLIAQNVAQHIYCQNQYILSTVGKISPIIYATSIMISKQAKVSNRPIGENSPDLVTWVRRYKRILGTCIHLSMYIPMSNTAKMESDML